MLDKHWGLPRTPCPCVLTSSTHSPPWQWQWHRATVQSSGHQWSWCGTAQLRGVRWSCDVPRPEPQLWRPAQLTRKADEARHKEAKRALSKVGHGCFCGGGCVEEAGRDQRKRRDFQSTRRAGSRRPWHAQLAVAAPAPMASKMIMSTGTRMSGSSIIMLREGVAGVDVRSGCSRWRCGVPDAPRTPASSLTQVRQRGAG